MSGSYSDIVYVLLRRYTIKITISSRRFDEIIRMEDPAVA
jgi:hypothetical protein